MLWLDFDEEVFNVCCGSGYWQCYSSNDVLAFQSIQDF